MSLVYLLIISTTILSYMFVCMYQSINQSTGSPVSQAGLVHLCYVAELRMLLSFCLYLLSACTGLVHGMQMFC